MSIAATPAPPAGHAGVDPVVADATPHRRTRFGTVIATHSIVDYFSFTIIPLLTVLEGRLDLSPNQGALLLALGSICSGVVQPLVAILSDRHDSRLVGVFGFLAAVLAIGSLGFVQTYPQLLLVQAIGTAGIGAFHPVGAASAGQLAGSKRSLGVSIFFVAGMLGGFAGNSISPFYVDQFGVRALAWLIIPGVLAVGAMAWAVARVPHRHRDAHDTHRALPPEVRKLRWRAVWLLFAGNAIRFTVNMALVTLLVRWAELQAMSRAGVAALDPAVRANASMINGPLQAAMQVGMAAGGLALGAMLAPKHQRTGLILVPCIGIAAIALFPFIDDVATGPALLALAWTVAVLTGIGYGGLVPVTISLAQRLLPHRTSLASGLMMGGAWSIAAIGPPLAQLAVDHLGLAAAFGLVALLLAVSIALAIALPRGLIRELSAH